MNNIASNRDVIKEIVKLLPFDDLIKMRRINRDYKTFIDTHFSHRYVMLELAPVPNTYSIENFDKHVFVKKIKYYLDRISDNRSKKIKKQATFNNFAYVLQHLQNLFDYPDFNPKFLRTVIVKIYELMHEFNYEIFWYDNFRKLFSRFAIVYRNICIKTPLDYLIYFDSDINCLQPLYQLFDLNDILVLRHVCKYFRSKYFSYNLPQNYDRTINSPIRYATRYLKKHMKTNNDVSCDMLHCEQRIYGLIDSIENKYQYIVCNKLANEINLFIKYFNFISDDTLKTVYNKLQNFVKQDFIATTKLQKITDAYFTHIIASKLHK